MNNACTIFQNASEVQVLVDDANEAEDLEDKIRKNQELAENIHRYLDVQEDCTLDPHENSIYINQDLADQPRYSDETTRLRNELHSKSNELQHYRKIWNEKECNFEFQINELKKRVTLAEAAKEQACLTHNNEHSLLVECKTQLSEAKCREEQFRQRWCTTEEKCNSLEIELQQTKTSLSDLQHKYNILDANNGKIAENRIDLAIKQLQDRNRAQTEFMQNQIEQLTLKLEEKEKSIVHLEACYNEMQKSRAMLQIESSETINQLSQKLEMSQKQQLRHSELNESNLELRKQLMSLRDENNNMQRTIQDLTQRLETSTRDLHCVESLVCEIDLNNSSKKLPFSRDNFVESTPIHDRNQHIKDELQRALQSIKQKREDIRRLELELSARNNDLKRIKSAENQMLIELTELQETNTKQYNKIKFLEDTLKNEASPQTDVSLEKPNNIVDPDVKSKVFNANELKAEKNVQDIEKKYIAELDNLKDELRESHDDYERVKNLYIQLSTEKDNVVRELIKCKESESMKATMLNVKNSQPTNRCSYIESATQTFKDDYNTFNETCKKCDKIVSNMKMLQLENVRQQNLISKYMKDLHDMENQLATRKLEIDELNLKLDLQEKHDKLINEMKEKATLFEDFMRRDLRSVTTSPQKVFSRSQSASTSPELLQSFENNEHKLREELTKTYAKDVKAIEKEFKDRIENYSNVVESLKNALLENEKALRVRNQEVDSLKTIILKEREQVAKVIRTNEAEARQIIEQRTETLQRYKQEIENLMSRLNENDIVIGEERTRLETLKMQLTTEKASFELREQSLKNQISHMTQESEQKIRNLKDKLRTSSKTLDNYKKYIEDKEQHLIREYERLKLGFKEASLNMENRMKGIIHHNEETYKKQLNHLEKEIEQLRAQQSD